MSGSRPLCASDADGAALEALAELVAIDDVQLDTATPCRPRACIRLWGGMLEDWMRPLLDAPAPPAAIVLFLTTMYLPLLLLSSLLKYY